MNTVNPGSPPTPTEGELLNENNFIEVNAAQLNLDEKVILYVSDEIENYKIRWVQIETKVPADESNDAVIGFRYLLNNRHTTMYMRQLGDSKFFRVNDRKNFDKAVSVRGNSTTEVINAVLKNDHLARVIGDNLGPKKSYDKGGRRKTRAKKKKRKITRRIRRKYNR